MTYVYIDKKIIPESKERIENRIPTCFLVGGYLGQGKTTLGVILAERYKKYLINYKTEYAIGGKDFIQKLKNSPETKAKVIIYDEAGDFSKKRTLTKFNQTMNEVLEMYRAFNVLLIVILPNVTKLDKGIYDTGAIKTFFRCWGRTTKRDYTLVDVYPLSKIYDLLFYCEKYKGKPMDFIYKRVSPIKTFGFKDLPKERSDELHKISMEQKRRRIDNIGNTEKANHNFDRMEEVYNKILLNPTKYLNDKDKINKDLIVFDFRIPDRMANAIKHKFEQEHNHTHSKQTTNNYIHSEGENENRE